MVTIVAEPRRPVENWKGRLLDWVTEIEQVIAQAKSWAERRQWATREDQKIIAEEMLGTYEAPRLLIHTPQGRLLLDPIAKEVLGVDGRFDFCVMPSYDSVLLVKTDQGWRFFSMSREDLQLRWSEESFEKVALELLKMQ